MEGEGLERGGWEIREVGEAASYQNSVYTHMKTAKYEFKNEKNRVHCTCVCMYTCVWRPKNNFRTEWCHRGSGEDPLSDCRQYFPSYDVLTCWGPNCFQKVLIHDIGLDIHKAFGETRFSVGHYRTEVQESLKVHGTESELRKIHTGQHPPISRGKLKGRMCIRTVVL